MKKLFWISLLLYSFPFTGSGQTEASFLEESRYFEFHSNYWINLHHFLYQQASGSQLRKLQEDGNEFRDVGETAVIAALAPAEASAFRRAVAYYKDHLIDKSLFRLSAIRVGLQEQSSREGISDSLHSAAFTAILNDFTSVYRTHFWPIHQAQNRRVLAAHIEVVRALEGPVIDLLSELSGGAWPDTKVRVDLTAYANYAGAYTPTRPRMNCFISTLDPFALQSDFVETVLHEGSHLLFTRESAFRSRIYFMSEELGMEFPKNLWHAAQFYLCGRLVQDLLQERGVEHLLVMDTRNIFTDYNTPSFRKTLEKYYQEDLDMESTIKALLSEL